MINSNESEKATIQIPNESEKNGSSKFLHYSQKSIDKNILKKLVNLHKCISTRNKNNKGTLANIPSQSDDNQMTNIQNQIQTERKPEKEFLKSEEKKNLKIKTNINLKVVPIKLMECKNLE